MLRFAFIATAAAVLAAGQGPSAPAPVQSAGLGDGARLLAPIRWKQLVVFPVARQGRAAAPAGLVPLAAALATKVVAVSEREGGGDVNHVTVANNGAEPLLLLGGELILGGQQDRIISKDTVVPPHQRMTVEVFCVEHGRWSGGRHFGSTGGLVENKVRLRAKYRGNQGEVWNQVAGKTAALGASSATGTYRQVAASPTAERAIGPFREHVGAAIAALPDQGSLVGFVAAINGRVTSIDVFDDPALFAAYRSKLLDAIFVTAADVHETDAAGRPPSADDIQAFVRKAEAAPPEAVTSSAGARAFEKKGKDVVGSTLELSATPAAPPKTIYRSYQADE
jgi:hypothetical protein